jgi:3'-phosphoadenosine 5'-phosphosulfate sulfotransferase (PAPS reductase)/FAD synthetase
MAGAGGQGRGSDASAGVGAPAQLLARLKLGVPTKPDGSIDWPAPDPSSPFFVQAPCLVSFSGGRTSALMLFLILWAHGGELPPGVFVCFANTGKEREETLRFLYECGLRWGVRIRIVEWRRPDAAKGKRLPPDQRFEEVGFNSAARNGEPFVALIENRGFLPNVATRFCTSDLKINTLDAFMRAQGFDRWSNAVGLRADEMHRVFKQVERNKAARRSTAIMPLAVAGITKQDVMAFWARQPFNLQLRGYEGNCDLCFLKGERILRRLVRDNPGMAGWWKEQEGQRAGATRDPAMANFSRRYTYAGLEAEVGASALLDLDLMSEDEEFDAECGLTCGGDDSPISFDAAAAVDRMLADVELRRAAEDWQSRQGGLDL